MGPMMDTNTIQDLLSLEPTPPETPTLGRHEGRPQMGFNMEGCKHVNVGYPIVSGQE